MNLQEQVFSFSGLSDQQVADSRKEFGTNATHEVEGNTLLVVMKETLTEPMFLLLVACSVIYFLLGKTAEGTFMLIAVLLVTLISLYQVSRSRKALASLKAYNEAKATVIRNGKAVVIPTEDIVVGDYLIIREGNLIQADGKVMQANDFTVNESILTGESFVVAKEVSGTIEQGYVAQGTLVVSGLGIVEVTNIGKATALGKIGTSIKDIVEEKTPLQIQIEHFVRGMAILGAIVFVLVWGLNFYISRVWLDSLLKSLTLAMSIIPEEIPVAFSAFMALGALRLMKQGVIVKKTTTIEALGAATVICTDKTGTITENKMELVEVYTFDSRSVATKENWKTAEAEAVITTAMWASEPIPFDPMELAIHEVYKQVATTDMRSSAHLIHEYALSGKPPAMTHVFEIAGAARVVAMKGAVEAVLQYSKISPEDTAVVNQQMKLMAEKGYRVLGVAKASFDGNDFPKQQGDFDFKFVGLVAFFDPPKLAIEKAFEQFYKAGIQLKIITGDNAVTTSSIAKQVHFRGAEHTMDGDELIKMNDQELSEKVANTTIFTRMFPEAKMRIINALKAQGHIVAMTGDGVNDGPALKSAHIAIAMGKRGSEMAKEVSSLILTDDDFSKMVDAIAIGRNIYNNLKKAIQYIISVHIPIILTVVLPLLLGWVYPAIFSPLHIIFLELIMGPTCSIVYENEPIEKNIMQQPPRKITTTFLSFRELSLSIAQGLFITLGTLAAYQYSVQSGYDESTTRTMVFTVLVIANILLTIVNRSFYYSIFVVLTYKNWMLKWIVLAAFALLIMLQWIPLFRDFFALVKLSIIQFAIASAIAFASVIWFEFYKLYKRMATAGSDKL